VNLSARRVLIQIIGYRKVFPMRPVPIAMALGALVVLSLAGNTDTDAQPRDELRAPTEFSNIADRPARARALFTEAAKVIMNPRCMNCHPATDRPNQGNDMHVHSPPVTRGVAGTGVAGNTCQACHMETNTNIFVGTGAPFDSIPGHPRWGLAPIEMAWEGKSMGEVCRQLKDPARNGGRSLALLHEHLAKDDLVAWGWNPGAGRDPVPGTQQRLGELIQAWIDAGAECP
jgi:cytochrome c5